MKFSSLASDIGHGRFDKTTHVVLSFVITFFGLLIMPIGAALVVAFAVGILKELYDKVFSGKRFDLLDIGADIVGIIGGYGVWQLMIA